MYFEQLRIPIRVQCTGSSRTSLADPVCDATVSTVKMLQNACLLFYKSRPIADARSEIITGVVLLKKRNWLQCYLTFSSL